MDNGEVDLLMIPDLNELLIICEGDLEQKVLRNFLSIYWRTRFIKCQVVNYQGNGGFKKRLRSDTNEHFRQHRKNYVLCLVDLFEEPFGVYKRGSMTVEEGFIAVQSALNELTSPDQRERFGAFPVVMEIETWLLADPEVQKRCCPGQSFQSPEKIIHPKAHLIELYKSRGQTYTEVKTGSELFGYASAKRIYEDSVPHFRMMIDWLNAPPVPPKTVTADDVARKEWKTRYDDLLAESDKLYLSLEMAVDENKINELVSRIEEIERQIDQQAAKYPIN